MKKYIVIASQGKSKILNLMLDTWSDGPDPLYKDNGQSVPFGDTFLIIGGNSDRVGMNFECIIWLSFKSPNIFIEKYDPDNEEFEVIPAQLSDKVRDHVAIFLPENTIPSC